MKYRIFACFFAISIALIPFSATAATPSSTGQGRYFLQNTKTFWKNAFQARRVFEEGFTAELSDFQLKLAKLAGMKPIPVKRFSILEEDEMEVVPTPVPTPTATRGWGVVMVAPSDPIVDGAEITVAILDTGVDREHPDFIDRVAGCTDYVAEEPVVDDSCVDENGHGTHIAGIIGADGGPEGMTGIAPAAQLLVYRVCNTEGICFSDDIAAAMNAAVDAGAQIIVLGFGGEEESSFVSDSLGYTEEHNVLVIAAAGNDGPYEDSVDWPARDPRVVSVGALDEDEMPAEFSSRGSNATTEPYQQDEGDVEFAAPGVNVESTFLDGGYAVLSGTSMAAPHVAGLAALLWNAEEEYPAEMTRSLLHKIVRDVAPEGDDPASGWGMPLLP